MKIIDPAPNGGPQIREHNGHRYRFWTHDGANDAVIQRYIDDVLVGGQDSDEFRRTTALQYADANLLNRLDIGEFNGLKLFIENWPGYKSFNCFGCIFGPEFYDDGTPYQKAKLPPELEPFRESQERMEENMARFTPLLAALSGKGFEALDEFADDFDEAAVPQGAPKLVSSEARDWNSERIGIPLEYYQFPPKVEDYGGAMFDDEIVESIAKKVDAWDADLAKEFREAFGSDGEYKRERDKSRQRHEDYQRQHQAEVAKVLAQPVVENTLDPTKAYLITLTGQGDVERKLVNHETFHYVCEGGEPPEAQVEIFAKDNEVSLDEARQSLREMVTGSSADNDRALTVRPDSFNGQSFGDWDDSTKALVKFLQKNGLELADEEYEGYIY